MADFTHSNLTTEGSSVTLTTTMTAGSSNYYTRYVIICGGTPQEQSQSDVQYYTLNTGVGGSFTFPVMATSPVPTMDW